MVFAFREFILLDAILMAFQSGSVIELNQLVGEALQIFIQGKLIATGEVVVVNEK